MAPKRLGVVPKRSGAVPKRPGAASGRAALAADHWAAGLTRSPAPRLRLIPMPGPIRAWTMGGDMGQGQLGADPAAMQSLMASGAIISMIFMIAFGAFFLLIGVVVPWFVWRTKVYTKRNYLLMRDWARWEQARTGPDHRNAA
jgi:hypothetical protein